MKLATAHVALQTTLSAAREFQQACACHRSTIRRCAFLPRPSPSRGKSARKSVLTKYFVLFPSLTLPYNARFRQVVGSVTRTGSARERTARCLGCRSAAQYPARRPRSLPRRRQWPVRWRSPARRSKQRRDETSHRGIAAAHRGMHRHRCCRRVKHGLAFSGTIEHALRAKALLTRSLSQKVCEGRLADRLRARRAPRAHRTVPAIHVVFPLRPSRTLQNGCRCHPSAQNPTSSVCLLLLSYSKIQKRPLKPYTTITSMPDSRSIFRSPFEIPRSVIVSRTADIGMIKERLRRPNFEESPTMIVRFAASDIARFTRASS